jgi:hypothetical protein
MTFRRRERNYSGRQIVLSPTFATQQRTRRLPAGKTGGSRKIALGNDATNQRDYDFTSWPRTSPPALAAVWILT